MRIVDRATFLALPAGTVYSKYTPAIFGDLCIKTGTYPATMPGDWTYTALCDPIEAVSTDDRMDKLDQAEANGSHLPLDLDCDSRDGLHDVGQLFAVWDAPDVDALIARLQRAKAEAY